MLTELSLRTAPYLKSPHVPRVPRRLQTILVTLEEELEEEPAEVNKRTRWSVERERSMKTLGAVPGRPGPALIKGDVNYD